MRVTVQPRREEAMQVGYLVLQDRLEGLDFETYKARLEPWKVDAFCDGDRVVGMLMRDGPELHVAMIPEVRGKWLSRRLIREVFNPIFAEHGRADVRVSSKNPEGLDFVNRIRDGFSTGRFDPATAVLAGNAALGFITSQKAADAQATAARDSNATQMAMYNQTRSDMAPFREAGYNALARLRGLTGQDGDLYRRFGMSDYRQDPGYAFRLSEGQKAIERSAAARGLTQSGANLKGIERFGQDYASNEYGNAFNRYQVETGNQFNRLAALAGIGQSATNQVGQNAMATGASIGNNMIGAGNARASGYVGGANAVTGAANSGINYYMQNQLMNRMFPQQSPGMDLGGYGNFQW